MNEEDQWYYFKVIVGIVVILIMIVTISVVFSPRPSNAAVLGPVVAGPAAGTGPGMVTPQPIAATIPSPVVSAVVNAPASEVFQYSVDGYPYTNALTFAQAGTTCPSGSVLATPEQLLASQQAGADACSWSWLSDGTMAYPVNESTGPGCGPKGIQSGPATSTPSGLANVSCFGPKPAVGASHVLPFNSSRWSQVAS